MSQSSRISPVVEMMVETAHEAFCVLDLDHRILALNEDCCRLLFLTRDLSLGQAFVECAEGWDENRLRKLLEVTLPRDQKVVGVIMEQQTRRGRRVLEINGQFCESEALVLLAAADVTDRADVVRDLRRRTEELEQRERDLSRQVLELSREVRRIEQEERRRISEVLHDDLQQRLYGIGMHITLARRRINGGRMDEADDHLGHVENWLDESIHILRTLAVELSPPVVMSMEIATTMDWLASHMRQLYDLSVNVDVEDVDLSEETRELLYKVCRELLFNVVKHAGVLKATVRVRRAGEHVELTVSDEGAGFDPQRAMREARQPTGLGLFSLNQRLRGFGGSLEIHSVVGEGTRIAVRLPLRA